VLRFNGDLVLINEQSMSEIVDTQVSDISPSGYIKGNQFYGLFVTNRHTLTRQLLTESKHPLWLYQETFMDICVLLLK
jgi:hypothetical protein